MEKIECVMRMLALIIIMSACVSYDLIKNDKKYLFIWITITGGFIYLLFIFMSKTPNFLEGFFLFFFSILLGMGSIITLGAKKLEKFDLKDRDEKIIWNIWLKKQMEKLKK
ncbi:hypothetical protein KAJ61_03370 [Candidatus Parcubacteria bacterium]|nr:hypothetical protein [Candidatus Parcubacteria bacterium]